MGFASACEGCVRDRLVVGLRVGGRRGVRRGEGRTLGGRSRADCFARAEAR